MSDKVLSSDARQVSIPGKTLSKLKAILEERNKIEISLRGINQTVGSIIGALVDAAGMESENLDDYDINIETGIIKEKDSKKAPSESDIEKDEVELV